MRVEGGLRRGCTNEEGFEVSLAVSFSTCSATESPVFSLPGELSPEQGVSPARKS